MLAGSAVISGLVICPVDIRDICWCLTGSIPAGFCILHPNTTGCAHPLNPFTAFSLFNIITELYLTESIHWDDNNIIF